MLQNQTASYEIQIIKSGTGAESAAKGMDAAAQAAQRLKNAANDANRANASVNATVARGSTAFSTLTNSTKTMTAGMRLFQTAAQQVGFNVLPQLTFAASAAASTINQLRSAGVESKAGFGIITAGVAGVAALAFTAAEAWRAYAAEKEAAASDETMRESLVLNADRLRELSKTAREEGKITLDEYRKLIETLKRPSDAGNQAVREFITKRETPGAQEQLGDFQRSIRQRDSGFNQAEAEGTPLANWERLKLAVSDYNRQVQLLQELQAAGTITEKQMTDAISDAAITRSQSITQTTVKANSQLKEYESLRSEITISTLSGVAQEKAVEVDRYNAEIQKIRELAAALGLEKSATEQVEQASAKAHTTKMQAIGAQRLGIMSLEDIQVSAAQSFSSGFANAFVSFVNGTKSAEDAFKQFAASFLTQIAEMIIQQMILNAIKSVLFGGGGTAVAASGGMFSGATYAANGIQSVSRPTYFQKFNVVAGEAGREMLTVLAKPRMMEIGGVESVVGMAGSKRLAISDADQLASRGGGVVDIRVHMEPGLRAEIVDESISGARVRVANDMQNDTPISRGVKRISS